MKTYLLILLGLLINTSFSNNLENNVLELTKNNSDVVYPESFGANGNDEIDDTKSIQKAINYCIENKLDLVFTKGKYIMSLTDRELSSNKKEHLGYAVIIKNASDFSIICKNTAVLKYDFSAEKKYNLFGVYNSKNLNFVNLNCYGGKKIRPYVFGDGLYQGAGVYIQDSNNISVKGGLFHNMFYGVEHIQVQI